MLRANASWLHAQASFPSESRLSWPVLNRRTLCSAAAKRGRLVYESAKVVRLRCVAAAFRQKKSIKVLLTKVREKAGRRRRRRRRRYQQTLTLISFVQKLSASQKK